MDVTNMGAKKEVLSTNLVLVDRIWFSSPGPSSNFVAWRMYGDSVAVKHDHVAWNFGARPALYEDAIHDYGEL